MKKGLLTFVLRTAGQDCTNRGLTSQKDQLLLVSEDNTVTGPFEIKEDEDYLVLVKRVIRDEEYLNAVPKSLLDSGRWTMFGGNFITTSDSRFPSKYPIPVHDRVEN